MTSSELTTKTRQTLLQLEAEPTVDVSFVAREAGDATMSPAQRREHRAVRNRRGQRLYVDMLFVLTHESYSAFQAEQLWRQIQHHKAFLAARLERNPGIAVAALDYLDNMRGSLRKPTVIPEAKLAKVAEVATRDGMTSLYDHATFHLSLHREFLRYERYQQPVSLLMLDVDHFKRYNDRYGHRAGDHLLMKIAASIAASVRELDIVSRYGGDEFAVIAPSTETTEACALGERIRVAVAQGLDETAVTLSAGVASCPELACSAESLIQTADQALYRAKAEGRNRLAIARHFKTKETHDNDRCK
jgi:diguanylate cyclase (GGDEF)-like protein